MRYESFYPFARQQQSPFSLGQPGFSPTQRMSPQQPPRQSFPGGPMNNPFGGQVPGHGMQAPPSKMEAYMQTANRFLNTAQQFAPMVQQFAPMVQNLPAMWKLYKGFQSLPPAGGAATTNAASTAVRAAARSTPSGVSVPRIFQPPI